jgi:hypothetical protein
VDYDLTQAQSVLLDSVTKVVDASRSLSNDAGYDAALDDQLVTDIDLAHASLLDRVLVAERLAELGTATTFALRAVLSSEVELPAGGATWTEVGRAGPVRYASLAAFVVLVDGADAWLVPLKAGDAEVVRSSYGYPYARINRRVLIASGTPIPDAERVGVLCKLAAAAEIAGNASAAIARTSEHLRERRQFGRPLSTFQALRHRVAEAAVTAEATRWMVREAAYSGDARAIELASLYAADAAAQLTPEVMQFCGARSFTLEFGLHLFAMRLEALRLELGGEDRLVSAVLRHDPT